MALNETALFEDLLASRPIPADLKPERVSETPAGFDKPRLLGPGPRFSDSGGVGGA